MAKKKIAVIGLGMLGSSLGLALAGGPFERLGWARRPETRRRAVELGVTDRCVETPEAALAEADLTVLALPIPATIDFLHRYGAVWPEGAVVTDIGSVKSAVMAAAERVFAGRRVAFVGSHPMAGTEKSGLDAAFRTLYANAEVFVTPPAGGDPAATALVRGMWEAVGTRVVEIDAATHDALVAHTSHVLHIVASALARSVLGAADPEERARRFSGCATGFRDTSRIASSNPRMWREVIEHNRPAVLAAMRDFERLYGEYRRLIETGDFDAFEAAFAEGKALRDAWMVYKERGKRDGRKVNANGDQG